MREITDIFTVLRFTEGKSLSLGEWSVRDDYYGGPHLDFAFQVHNSWYKAIGFAKAPIERFAEFCRELEALTRRKKKEVSFCVMYGNFSIGLTTNSLANFNVSCQFSLYWHNPGEIQDEFETYVIAVDEFRLGIEAVLKEIEEILDIK